MVKDFYFLCSVYISSLNCQFTSFACVFSYVFYYQVSQNLVCHYVPNVRLTWKCDQVFGYEKIAESLKLAESGKTVKDRYILLMSKDITLCFDKQLKEKRLIFCENSRAYFGAHRNVSRSFFSLILLQKWLHRSRSSLNVWLAPIFSMGNHFGLGACGCMVIS